MRTLNFFILFVYLNFNKFPSSDFRVHWNARNSEKRTQKFRLPSILERGISPLWSTTQNSGVVLVPTVYLSYVLMSSFILGLQVTLHPHHTYSYHVPSGYTNTMYIMRPPHTRWKKPKTFHGYKSIWKVQQIKQSAQLYKQQWRQAAARLVQWLEIK